MPKTSSLCAIALLSTILLCSACVNIAYDGEAKTPKAKRSQVQVFSDPAKLPAGYKVLGTAIADGPSTVTATEIQSKLVDFAKKSGADGVLLLSVDRIPDGVLRADQIYGVAPIGGSQAPAESAKVSIKAQLLEFPKPVAAKPAIEAIPVADDVSGSEAQPSK